MIESPHSQEAEQALLGALLCDVNQQHCREALDIVACDDFYARSHRILFEQIKYACEAKQSVDLVTTTEALKSAEKLDDVGGFVYLANLMKTHISFATVTTHAHIISSLSQSRMLISVTSQASELLHSKKPVNQVVEYIESNLRQLSNSDNGKHIPHISSFADEWIDSLEELSKNGGGITGLATGIDSIDQALAGFDPDSLIILAGRPSHGKTYLAQTILNNVSFTQDLPSIMFSLEMGGKQVLGRFASGLSGVCSNALRTGQLDNTDWSKLVESLGVINDSKLHLETDTGLALGQIRARARRHVAKYGKQALIVIDYLGLMKLPKAESNTLAIAEITRSLKGLAKELQTPVLLLAQANREADKAHRPNMSHLAGSAAIEADADVVMFVYRDEVMNTDSEMKGITEVIIAKDRHNNGNGVYHLVKGNGGLTDIDQQSLAELIHAEESRNKPKRRSGFTEGNDF